MRKVLRNLAQQLKSPYFVTGGLFAFGISTYLSYFYFGRPSPDAAIPTLDPMTDVSDRYNTYADDFDQEVGFTESITLLNRLRKNLVKKAHGHVLEVSVGTGRNAAYYHVNQCKSITFLDQSGPMVQIARQKWKALHPRPLPGTNVAFRVQDCASDIPAPADGFDTIVQTMGVCSTPEPAQKLRHLSSLLKPDTGRLLLLEHGRSWYEWINWSLDKDAAHHADRFGCWFNRDIGRILDDTGLIVVRCERPYWWNLGTIWLIEARRPLS